MDCREAQLVISAVYDRQPVDAADLEATRAHLAACPQCAAFRTGLAAISAVPAPVPPEGLAERVLGAVEAAGSAAAAAAEEETVRVALASSAASPKGILDTEAQIETPAWLTRRRLWIGTAVTAAAAALVAGVIVLGSGLPFANTSDTSPSALTATSPRTSAAPVAGEAAKDTAPVAVAGPPDYVTFRERVYKRFGRYDGSPSGLTTAGTVATALDTNTSSNLPVLRTADPLQLVVRDTGGNYILFQMVTRPLSSKLYALVAGTPITRYGQWPTMPPSLGVPMNAEGSPVFRKWGKDDTGVEIFTRPGSQPQTGFAVAPGTKKDDPAAGNPGWTWWLPIE